LQATFTKLRSGEWGIRIVHETPFDAPAAGDEIEVTKKDGSTDTATVKNVIWTGSFEDTGQITIAGIE
jgi:hypothetical protein